MAAPNIVNVALINANSNTQILTTTSEIGLLSNPASSGKVYKVNTIIAANKAAGQVAVNVSVNVYSAAALGGTSVPIAQFISVPGGASLIVIDKSTSFYLQENQSIGIKGGANNGISVLCSWEEIS